MEAEGGVREAQEPRGLEEAYKRQPVGSEGSATSQASSPSQTPGDEDDNGVSSQPGEAAEGYNKQTLGAAEGISDIEAVSHTSQAENPKRIVTTPRYSCRVYTSAATDEDARAHLSP